MTREQMEAIRDKVIAALRTGGIEHVEAVEFEDGEALPILLTVGGRHVVLSLDVV